MAYKHGVFVSEIPTSIIPPVLATAGLPVVFGTAPINLGADQQYANKPFLAYSKEEAIAALGYSSDWEKYSLCEFMVSYFDLFNVAPVVFVNVLNLTDHKLAIVDTARTLVGGIVKLAQTGILLNTLVLKLTVGGTLLVKNTDYTAAFNSAGEVVITRVVGGLLVAANSTFVASYDYLDAAAVDSADIIGGVDGTTGAVTGLELINKVFPLFQLVPGQIVAPGWSHNSAVAAVMVAKASSINGLFKAIAITDVDATNAGADLYTEVPAWKNTNNYSSTFQLVGWPKLMLDDVIYYMSSQLAGLISKTDALNDDIPYVSPSNQNLQAVSAVTAAGLEVSLGPDQAAYLNGNGIITAMNFIGGWKLWGNYTGAFPASTDVKDVFGSIRRMFNWVGNTIILTFMSKVDSPMKKRTIDSIVDSLNIWLNGLTARGALLGGHVEFRTSENPSTDLLAGKVNLHVFLTPPVPMQEINFALEFDVNNLNALFA
ncbi:phage tail sheath family protein [Paenibacillus psychroresistens]|uniref:Phage tail sheath family protein n=1 Tax=Paenibacillus psychroresistens TaxID=1778678 RepID=A0A6B8RJ33_9BACL|nr:phage tail sheath family protein [Paenibacillus psychroresistens]QGQ95867.1 phage tail sheath family protein [Paenibacillus psychroresistens]